VRERDIHRAIVDYLRLALPKGSVVLTLPGGDGQRTQAPGYVKGTPDIACVVIGKPAIFVEVKGPKGKASMEQIAMWGALEDAGALVAEIRSIEEMHETLIGWGIAPRISVKRAAA
jgi:hypothetical protein